MPRWLVPLAIGAIGLLAYSNSFDVPFVFDDNRNIAANPHVQWERLSLEGMRDAATKSPLDRPVAYLSFGLNHYLGGLDTRGYHALNLIIHLCSGWLAWMLAGRLLRRDPRLAPSARAGAALFAALVFVAHPLQTQAVTYVVQRMTSLATAFYLLAFWLYLVGRDARGGARRAASWLGASAAWLLALGSKEIAVTLPLAILLYELCLRRDGALARLRWVVLGTGAVMALLVSQYAGDDPARWLRRRYELLDFSLVERLWTQPRVVFLYLGLALWPLPGRLNLLHGVEVSRSLFDPPVTALALAGLLALAATALALVRRAPLLAFGIGWLLLHLALESSLLPLALVYEHRMYLPMFGVSLLAARALAALPSRPAAVALGTALVLSLALGTWLRNRDWADEIRLWSDVLAKNPSSHEGHNNLGAVLVERGRFAEALAHHREAVRLAPDSVQARINLGRGLRELGDLEGASAEYREALRLNPRFPEAHNNLGVVLSRTGRHDEAIAHYREALLEAPHLAHVHNNLGAALLRRGDVREALASFERAIELDPDYMEPRHNRQVALGLLADQEEGESEEPRSFSK